jgi:DNA recombination protein RmuC
MEILLLILIVLVVVVGVVLYLQVNRISQKSGTSLELMEWLKSSDARFSSGMTAFNSRLDNAAHVISSLQKEVGVFTEIGRSMKDLQALLQSPKLRGNVGEQILTDMLKQYFPPTSYALQHTFENGEKVDALIKTANGNIPIDSKFPMENFRSQLEATTDVDREAMRKLFVKDVKKHIGDIARKYILPAQHTTDYALMYIPSEAIYYEIIKDADLYDFASGKRILPVSPMSFYAYIQAILMSYEGQRIEQQAKQIIQIIQGIKSDYEKVDESMQTMGRHVTNAYNQIPHVTRSINAIGQKVTATQLMTKSTIELEELPPVQDAT